MHMHIDWPPCIGIRFPRGRDSRPLCLGFGLMDIRHCISGPLVNQWAFCTSRGIAERWELVCLQSLDKESIPATFYSHSSRILLLARRKFAFGVRYLNGYGNHSYGTTPEPGWSYQSWNFENAMKWAMELPLSISPFDQTEGTYIARKWVGNGHQCSR